MTYRHDRAIEQIARAREVLPGGVSSNFRLNGVPVPLTFTRGEGCRLTDVDGNVYVDYAIGMGANILGHAPAPVIDAVRDSLDAGQLYAGQHPAEAELAFRLRDRMPSMERIRFNGSGAEAVHAALRLARAFTGRRLVVKFEGHYHGWFDDVLANTGGPWGTPDATGSVPVRPMSAGQVAPDGIAVLPWNDPDALDRFLAARGGEVAAIINEPIGCNTCVIEPLPGYAAHVRAAADRAGALLIYDEVITGIRVAPGGAQERLGIRPDLTIVAKAIGGGFPLGAFLATKEAAKGMVAGTHGSTFGGNPLATAVGNAVLDVMLEPGFLEGVEQKGLRLKQLMAALKDENPDMVEEVRGHGLLAGVRLNAKYQAGDVMKAATGEKLLTVSAGDNVIRLLPSLTVTEEEMKEGIARLSKALKVVKKAAG